MYDRNRTRLLSKTQDQFINRQMGNGTIEECVELWASDAGTPADLDALAFQLLCVARRCKTNGAKVPAANWKEQWRLMTALADAARARLAANPSRETHPGFWSNRSVGRPGHLDSDLFLPLVARVDLGRPTMFTYSYEPELVDGEIYEIGSCVRHSRVFAYFKRPGFDRGAVVPTSMARGLQAMGRLIALPLSAIAPPALKAAA